MKKFLFLIFFISALFGFKSKDAESNPIMNYSCLPSSSEVVSSCCNDIDATVELVGTVFIGNRECCGYEIKVINSSSCTVSVQGINNEFIGSVPPGQSGIFGATLCGNSSGSIKIRDSFGNICRSFNVSAACDEIPAELP